jgi:hypothetical protein
MSTVRIARRSFPRETRTLHEIEEVKPRKLRPGIRVAVNAGQVVPGEGQIM